MTHQKALPRSHAALPGLLRLAVLLVSVLPAGGCMLGMFPVERSLVTLEPEPIYIHFPGIGGDNFLHHGFLRALRTGGFDADLRLHDWTDGRFPITALQDHQRNRAIARKVAARVASLRRNNPDRPIYLSSESGGAGIMLWVLEELPDDVTVDAAVLIAPAVSPDYDLTPALRHVDRTLLAFHSPRDWFILGLGTSLFGTMDGQKTEAAGKLGFRMPPHADPQQYAKLRSIRYDGDWWWSFGYGGGHFDCLSPRFASGFLAPILTELARSASGPAPSS